MPALRSGVPMNITLQAVSYTHLLAEADGRYTVTVLADSAWLQSADCVYPVRIDPTVNISDSSIGLYDVEQGSANTVMGDNNYPYCGYDDGITSKNLANYNKANLMTRTYVMIDYDFSQLSAEAKVDSATFSLYHYTSWSKGQTNFGLYEAVSYTHLSDPGRPENGNGHFRSLHQAGQHREDSGGRTSGK